MGYGPLWFEKGESHGQRSSETSALVTVATEYKVDISESTFVFGPVPVQGNAGLSELELLEEYLKNGSHLSLPLSTVFPLM